MSGHHPAHTRMPMGNPPPVEHGIGGWNHISHEAPGVGLLPGALNPQQPNLLRGMVPQTAHLGSALPLHSSHAAWLNKVPGSSQNGDGSGLLPSPSVATPSAATAAAAATAANELFMQIIANRDRGVAAAVATAGYRAAHPYQDHMIDLSRPSAPLERTEPLPLLTGNCTSGEKESHASRNGNVTSESATPINGEVNLDSKCSSAVVSVIAANPSHEKSVELKVGGKVDYPVRSYEGGVDLNNKTDSDKGRAPTQHLRAAAVQTIVGHSKKVKSVEAIVENLFELGSKKQEADSTNTPGTFTDSTSQSNCKPISAQIVPKSDSNVSDWHGDGEDGDSKMRRKRKIDTPTRKSMSPPPVKKTLMFDQGIKPAASVNPEISSQSLVIKPSLTPPSIPTVSDGCSSVESPPTSTVSMTVSSNTNPSPAPVVTHPPVTTSVLATVKEISHPTIKSETPTPALTTASSDGSVCPSQCQSSVKDEVPPPAATSQSSVVPVTSECPVSALTASAQKEDTKSAVVDVESKMEALFAGIIGSGDEGAAGPNADFGGDLSNPLTPFNESLDLDTSSNIAAVLEAKPPSAKKGRPKGSRNGIRQSSDSIFGTSSTESTPQKGKKAKKKTSKDNTYGESPGKKNKKSIVAGKKAKFLKEPSQQTCDSGSTVSSVRIRGPVVHCVGPRDNPNQVSIVNAPSREDEDQEKSKKPLTGRRKLIQNEGKITSSGLCSTILVTRGELDHPQLPSVWVCVFCKLGPHVDGAGDLFGPYLIGGSDSDSDHDINEKKKGKGAPVNAPPGSHLGVLPVTPSLGEKTHYIVWLHEDCAVWASGVYFVGARLAGLDDAVWAALNTKCDRCRHYGANLGCLHHGCSQRAHYKCAQDSGWHLSEDFFKSTCSIHPLKDESN